MCSTEEGLSCLGINTVAAKGLKVDVLRHLDDQSSGGGRSANLSRNRVTTLVESFLESDIGSTYWPADQAGSSASYETTRSQWIETLVNLCLQWQTSRSKSDRFRSSKTRGASMTTAMLPPDRPSDELYSGHTQQRDRMTTDISRAQPRRESNRTPTIETDEYGLMDKHPETTPSIVVLDGDENDEPTIDRMRFREAQETGATVQPNTDSVVTDRNLLNSRLHALRRDANTEVARRDKRVVTELLLSPPTASRKRPQPLGETDDDISFERRGVRAGKQRLVEIDGEKSVARDDSPFFNVDDWGPEAQGMPMNSTADGDSEFSGPSRNVPAFADLESHRTRRAARQNPANAYNPPDVHPTSSTSVLDSDSFFTQNHLKCLRSVIIGTVSENVEQSRRGMNEPGLSREETETRMSLFRRLSELKAELEIKIVELRRIREKDIRSAF